MQRPLLSMFATFGLTLTACNSPVSTVEQTLEDEGCVVDPGPRACDPADDKKTTVCHIPPGNPANAHTICVGNPAVEAHLAHGDILGTCDCPGDADTDADAGVDDDHDCPDACPD